MKISQTFTILMLLLTTCQCSVDYEVPELTLETQFLKKPMSINGPLQDLLQNDLYIGQIASERIDLWYKDNLTHFLSIQYGDGQATYLDSNVTDADLIKQNSELIYIMTLQQFYEVNLTTNSVIRNTYIYGAQSNNVSSLTVYGLSIEVSKNSVFILTVTYSSGTFVVNKFVRYKLSDWSVYTIIFTYLTESDIVDTDCSLLCEEAYPTASQSSYTNTTSPTAPSAYEYIAIWGSTSFTLQIYKCEVSSFVNGTSCSVVKIARDSTAFNQQNEFDFRFNHDCTKFIYDIDYNNSYTIESVDGSFSQNYHRNLIDPASNKSWTLIFMDYEQEIVLLMQNSLTFAYYNTNLPVNSTYVDTATTERNFYWLSYDIQKEKIFVFRHKQLATYSFQCAGNTSFSSIGKCLSTTQTNLTTTSNDTLLTDNSNDTVIENDQNSQNQNATEETNIYKGYSEVQIQILDAAQQVLNSTSTTAAFTAITFSFLPFSAVFIKLISFWTVCSFYALVDIDFPQFLRQILIKVFKVTNISLLEEYKILTIPTLYVNTDKSNDKFAEYLITKYGLTSDFVTLNFESCCMVAFSMLLLTLLNGLSKFKSSDSDQKQNSESQNKQQQNTTQKNTKSQRIFDIDVANLASGQLLSLAPMFMIGVFLLKGRSDFQNKYEKLNLLLFTFCIGFTLSLPFLYISYASKRQFQNEFTRKKQVVKFNPNTIKALTVLFFYTCNITVPFMAVMNYPKVFMSVNFLIFGLGIYCAWKAKYTSKFRRMNSVVLSLWLMLIHIAATVMHFLGQKDYPQINCYAAMAFVGFLTLGAVHELLNFFFIQLLYDGIYTFVKKVIFRSVRVQETPSALNMIEFQKETIEKHQNPTIKMKDQNSMTKAKRRGNKNSSRKKSVRNDDEIIYKNSRFQPHYAVRIMEQKKKIQIEDSVRPAPSPWLKEFANKNRLKIKRVRIDSPKKREQKPQEPNHNENIEEKIDQCVSMSKKAEDSPKKQRPSDSKDQKEKRDIPHKSLRPAITFKRSLQQRANKLRGLLTTVQSRQPRGQIKLVYNE